MLYFIDEFPNILLSYILYNPLPYFKNSDMLLYNFY